MADNDKTTTETVTWTKDQLTAKSTITYKVYTVAGSPEKETERAISEELTINVLGKV